MSCQHDHEHQSHHHCDHEHDHPCHHNHDHQCGDPNCSGEHHHSHVIELSRDECDFLVTLGALPAIPLTRFLMTSTKSSHLESIALSPCYITDITQTVAQVNEIGDTLLDFEEMGLIDLDYESPIEGHAYALHQNSAAYHALEDVVREGSTREDFLFDRAELETGRIVLTELGKHIIEQIKSR